MEEYAIQMAKEAKDNHEKPKVRPLPVSPKECDVTQRTAWLKDQVNLKDSPFLKKCQDMEAAVKVLLEFWDMFSHDASYGRTHLLKHRIITKDVPPSSAGINPSIRHSSRAYANSLTRGSSMASSSLPTLLGAPIWSRPR